MSTTTRELLLRTHLPQANIRVSDEFSQVLLDRLRTTPKNANCSCKGIQHYILYDRILFTEIPEVGPAVFETISNTWKEHFPARSACIVRAAAMSQVEVMCPVSTTAGMLMTQASQSTWSCYFGQLALQGFIVSLLFYALHYNFLEPYSAWLDSEESGLFYYFFKPIQYCIQFLLPT